MDKTKLVLRALLRIQAEENAGSWSDIMSRKPMVYYQKAFRLTPQKMSSHGWIPRPRLRRWVGGLLSSRVMGLRQQFMPFFYRYSSIPFSSWSSQTSVQKSWITSTSLASDTMIGDICTGLHGVWMNWERVLLSVRRFAVISKLAPLQPGTESFNGALDRRVLRISLNVAGIYGSPKNIQTRGLTAVVVVGTCA